MALVKCPDCGRDVSDRATACPQCGGPVVLPTVPAEQPTPPQPVAILAPQRQPAPISVTPQRPSQPIQIERPESQNWIQFVTWTKRAVAVALSCAAAGALIGFASSPSQSSAEAEASRERAECRAHPDSYYCISPEDAATLKTTWQEEYIAGGAAVGASVGLLPAIPAGWFLVLFVLGSVAGTVRNPKPTLHADVHLHAGDPRPSEQAGPNGDPRQQR